MVFASKPLNFNKPPFQVAKQWVYDHTTQAARHREIITAKLNIVNALVQNVVSFNDKGVIKPEQVMVPGAEPWFHLQCQNPHGATFEIITDGEEWYPINSKTGKISHSQQPRRSLNLDEINQLDKIVVNAAIDHYMNKQSKDT